MFHKFKNFIKSLFKRQKKEIKIELDKEVIQEIGEEIGAEIRKGLSRAGNGVAVQEKEEIKIRETYVSPLNGANKSKYDYYFDEEGFKEEQILNQEIESSSKALRKISKEIIGK